MSKNSAQSLVLVIFIVTAFCAITITVAALMARELEFREIEESSLKAGYASDSGYERARYHIKVNKPLPQTFRTIISGTLTNGYTYTVIITPYRRRRSIEAPCPCPSADPDCCCLGPENYCIDSSGESP